MIRNHEYFEALLANAKNPFNFDGEIKFYPGREMIEAKARIFKTHDLYMDFLTSPNFSFNEFIVIDRVKKEIGARLTDEIASFQLGEGERKIAYYDDLIRDRSEEMETSREELRRELQALMKELREEKAKKSKKSKKVQKLAS